MTMRMNINKFDLLLLNDFDWLFLDYCKNNNLKSIERIMLFNIPSKAIINYGFELTCENGHLEIAKWFYYNVRSNIIRIIEGYLMACINGHLEVAKWLYFEEKLNIPTLNDTIFMSTYTARIMIIIKDRGFVKEIKRNIELVKWLTTICDNYYVEIEDEKIISCKILGKFQVLLKNKEFNKIIEKLKIPIKKFEINEEDKCAICFNDKYNFLTSCNHTFCVECFMIWYINHEKKECSYCQQKIEIEKCCILES